MTDPDIQVNARGVCATCDAATSKTCGGCCDASEVVEGAHKTFYCSMGCQKADWNTHKSECKRLTRQKSLYQAGDLLRRLWLLIQEQSYGRELDKVVVEDNKVTVFETVSEGGHVYPDASAHSLFADDWVKDTVLNFMACADALTNMRDLLKILFSGMCDRFEEVTLLLKDSSPKITLFNRKGRHGAYREIKYRNPASAEHTVFRVRLKKEGIWLAIDLTNAQFGYFDTVIPWGKYHRTQRRILTSPKSIYVSRPEYPVNTQPEP